MEVLYPKCAGLDVHKDVVVACARIAVDGKATQEVRSFGTTTTALFEFSAWLEEQQCTHVVMEATGVYWKPVWHVLEGTFELMLANAQHVRNVPGRKSDVNDAMWLSDLLAHRLVRGSFVPPTPIQEVPTSREPASNSDVRSLSTRTGSRRCSKTPTSRSRA
jgi:transposase